MALRSILVIAAATALLGACSGCSTTAGGNDPLAVQRAVTEARGVHATVCENVVKLHDAKTLTGEAFNKAKAYCITADDALDAGDLARATFEIGRAKALSGQ